jgi:catechol 2,3-dioxygenase-like lactoylglutathione lyase family enzyme
MSRLHVHISVEDIDQNIRFYSALFGSDPSVIKADYAKWDLAEPAVNFAISKRGPETGLDHIGIQADNDTELTAIQSRLQQAGIAGHEQRDAACCYARSDKYWTQDPQGIAWESFHSLETIPTFSRGDEAPAASGCCVPKMATAGCC